MSERDVRLYIEDMLEFSERAMRYAKDHNIDGLLRDTMRYDAILRNLELIGEAATHVPAAVTHPGCTGPSSCLSFGADLEFCHPGPYPSNCL